MNRIHASHADSAMCYCLRIRSNDILKSAYPGDFLKELQLTEGRSTGFPKIYQAMKANGSPEPTFETDEDRFYFLAKLPIHSSLKERAQVGAQAGAQGQKYDLNKTERAILAYLNKGPSSRSEIIEHLGSSRSGYFKETLKGLLQKDLIEYTYPDSPTHPNQKYKITDAGKQYVG